MTGLVSLSALLTLSIVERRAMRDAADLDPHDHPPVVVVEGDDAPRLTGQGAHYETKGGTWIRYPSAYGRKGRSNMVYCASTRRVEVGAGWLLRYRTGARPSLAA